MKKIICVFFSLIMVLGSAAAVFAVDEVFRIDAFTGEVVDSSTGQSTNYVRLTSTCTYDRTNKEYIYATGLSGTTDVRANIYDGMVTTDSVSINPGESANLTLYKGGEPVDPEKFSNLTEPGTYVLRDLGNEVSVLSFTIVKRLTGALSYYNIPPIFYINKVSFNGESMPTAGNSIDMEKEGKYYVQYTCSATGVTYYLDVETDHTFPELEIIGLKNGIARNPVTFGPTEPGSSLAMKRDGEYIAVSRELKTAGSYTVIYSDEAGNESTYYFTIRQFFDTAAWMFIVLAVVLVGAVTAYAIYSRKNFRVR